MKALSSAATALFVLCLPLALLSGGIWWGATSPWLYASGFERHGVAARTGFSEVELERIAAGLIEYFSSAEDDPLNIAISRNGQVTRVFTREEALHFRDVRGLLQLDVRVLLGAGSYLALFAAVAARRRAWRRLARGAFLGGALTLALLLILVIGSLADFNALFLQFHFLVFSNDYWSAPGNMLLLFPGGFWYDAVVGLGLGVAGVGLALGTAGGLYLRRARHRGS